MPIFFGERLLGLSQVFGHHDDVGGSVPGSLPVDATDMWQEGLVIPPVKLSDRGVLNEAVLKIVARNSRLSEHLRGDVDAEIGATGGTADAITRERLAEEGEWMADEAMD